MDNEESTFISGIHNWCDRWCERCSFTARCRVFEREQERDINSPDDFWNSLSENFKETLEMLHAMAEEQGIDMDQILADTKKETSLEEEDKLLDEHPLSVITDQYLFEGKDWLESLRIKNYFEGLVHQLNLGLMEVSKVEIQKAKIEEALEVIHWYLFFVHVKSKRVLNDLLGDFWDEFPEEEKSYNGSAKIAMISMERSMQAWKLLFDLLEDEQDSILNLLVLLDKSRKMLAALVPNYALFIRPGFDE
ncbi:hypothetical protein LV84_00683 [Algoriphagus ratkowskyi]|uniref:Uncharacterized protein n=1 Tax=Algoriphagus ratkowskyi TaxID=57028 RepID=A0A2W7RN63_9BACT|nr:hypothetical protein [Algoriphagus ratkowskyi]PZX60406.1 hypothetical protein LV84_00683 [Algoriphagus ratkowskyi]TXD78217.1 hypothetical protein ESW18_09250 [Algoriphagus ratkowskyi]